MSLAITVDKVDELLDEGFSHRSHETTFVDTGELSGDRFDGAFGYNKLKLLKTTSLPFTKGVVFECQKPEVESSLSQLPALRQEVLGAIDEISEFSVSCELEVKKDVFCKIALPISYFDFELYIGRPVAVSLDNSSGYAKPKVSSREVSADFKAMYLEEIDSLIAELD